MKIDHKTAHQWRIWKLRKLYFGDYVYTKGVQLYSCWRNTSPLLLRKPLSKDSPVKHTFYSSSNSDFKAFYHEISKCSLHTGPNGPSIYSQSSICFRISRKFESLEKREAHSLEGNKEMLQCFLFFRIFEISNWFSNRWINWWNYSVLSIDFNTISFFLTIRFFWTNFPFTFDNFFFGLSMLCLLFTTTYFTRVVS